MIIHTEKIRDFDFRDYGIYFNMFRDRERVMHSSGVSFEDHMTCRPLIDTPGHLGCTIGQSAPYALHSMEKHAHTMVAVFCAADPVILCVAKPCGDRPPRAADVHALLLGRGDVAVLKRDIWHDACHGVGRPAAYYYIASRGENPAEWVKVEGEAVVEPDDFF